MDKIKLETTEQEEVPKEPKKRRKKKKLFIFLGILAIALILLTFFLILPVLSLNKEASNLMVEVKGAGEAIQVQDLDTAFVKLESTGESLDRLNSEYRKMIWLKFIPFVGGFYWDGERLFAGGQYLLESVNIAVESLQPYADLLGFEKKEEEKEPGEMTMEDRLMLVLDTLDKLQPSLDEIGQKLELAQKEVDQIDPQRYPEAIFGKKVRQNVVLLKNTVDGAAKAAIEAKPIIGFLKPLLGIPEEKKYLLLFQNDAELRPTGGFLTAYAILSVHNGNFKPLGSYDIYGLDARFGNRLKAPQPILDYHKNVSYWHLRDMNLSPDFKKSMETFWENYTKVGRTDIDGIIAVDTQVLVNILKVLGPIGVADWGNFSAENDPRCDCPQVFYELERQITKPTGTLRTERKAVLGPLMHSILLNVMQSPRKNWPEFFNVVFANIQEKHLLFYFFDEEIQGAIEALNAAGRIKEYDGDYFHLNDCNFAGAKSNMFIEQNVTQEIEIGSDGAVTKTVTIDYRNPAPPSNCNLEAGELCLNAPYRDWIRLFVPQGSQLIEATGSEIEVRTYEDLGKTVFEAFYGDKAPLRPQGKAQLTFKYELPFKVGKDQEYKLLIQKQPGTKTHEYIIKLDGQLQNFELRADKEVKF
ncbi:MAG TPA: DUF4012 domain-containing protein [Nevskiaceae bacterium]|nr:DUF4012 domain-containing protein [Nevskiaceae bacterium]